MKIQMGRHDFFLGLLIATIALIQCASPIAPKGGPKDETPPTLDSLNSSVPEQINFKKDKLVFAFDEWVKLDKPSSQIVISPTLEYPATYDIKGKAVHVEFHEDEVLRENTTYVINFGQSIQDITESNPLTGFKYVFSTGSFIDSLIFRAKVIDAFTAEPVKDCLVMLYENKEDSVVYKDKPYYFGYTSELGLVEISNIKSGQFKVLAMEDKNGNFIKDLDTERLGFVEDSINMGDSSQTEPIIRIFSQEEAFRITESRSDQYGSIEVQFSKPIFNASAHSLNDSIEVEHSLMDKKLTIFYEGLVSTAFKIAYQLDDFQDTIRVRPRDKKTWLQKNRLKLISPSNKPEKLFPNDTLSFSWNAPIDRIDLDRWKMIDSTDQNIPFKSNLSLEEPEKIEITADWSLTPIYLTLLDSAIVDFYGRYSDSLTRSTVLDDMENYTNLNLSLTGLDNMQPYSVSILYKEKEVFQQNIEGIDSFHINLKMLHPDTHSLEIIDDDNKNGKWDSGDYLEKLQPERIRIYEIGGFRANWDLDKLIDLKE